MKLLLRITSIVAIAFFSLQAQSAMQINQAIIDYQPGDTSRKDIEISNPDPEPLYVQVEVKRVVNPGMPDEKTEVVTNPKESGLLVTPSRLAIQPGARKLVRVVNLKPLGDKEKVFRIALTPVPADIEAETTGVKILVGYQILVLMQPMVPTAKVEVTRAEGKLTLTNSGNTNVLFVNGKQCPESDKGAENKENAAQECEAIPAFRLYAGATHEVELKYKGAPIEFLEMTGSSGEMKVY